MPHTHQITLLPAFAHVVQYGEVQIHFLRIRELHLVVPIPKARHAGRPGGGMQQANNNSCLPALCFVSSLFLTINVLVYASTRDVAGAHTEVPTANVRSILTCDATTSCHGFGQANLFPSSRTLSLEFWTDTRVSRLTR